MKSNEMSVAITARNTQGKIRIAASDALLAVLGVCWPRMLHVELFSAAVSSDFALNKNAALAPPRRTIAEFRGGATHGTWALELLEQAC